MPPTPQALDFVFTQILSPDQLEEYICSFWPEGIQLVHLRAALTAPPFGSMNYAELLAAVAECSFTFLLRKKNFERFPPFSC